MVALQEKEKVSFGVPEGIIATTGAVVASTTIGHMLQSNNLTKALENQDVRDAVVKNIQTLQETVANKGAVKTLLIGENTHNFASGLNAAIDYVKKAEIPAGAKDLAGVARGITNTTKSISDEVSEVIMNDGLNNVPKAFGEAADILQTQVDGLKQISDTKQKLVIVASVAAAIGLACMVNKLRQPNNLVETPSVKLDGVIQQQQIEHIKQ